ncbi:MAG: 6,7-dimethyl-8-ribityllumazine synthase [Alphaproteobacteria bacterium]
MPNGPRVLIIQARFYTEIADHLLAGARGALEAADARIETLDVPGALEIPAALAMARDGDRPYDAYVLLGCVIRGETGHYHVVVSESARGTMDLVTRYGLAVGFGILTVDDREQADARARVDRLNKGGEAASAALAMYAIRKRFAS